MAIQAAAGTKLYASISHPATYDESGYSAIKTGATEIGEVTNIGEFGKEFASVTSNSLSQRATRKKKGSYNNGTLSPTLNLDTSDAGQLVMETLLDSDDPGTFFVELPDGTTYGLEGLVMTYRPSIGEIDSIITATCSVEVTENDVVKIAAS